MTERHLASIETADSAIVDGDAGFVFSSIEFDVSVSETHKTSGKVTDHPVESGAQIVDHYVNNPDTLDLSVIVSNTPLVESSARAFIDPHRAEAAYVEIVALKKKGTPLSVFTTLHLYDAMVIIETSVMRNKDTGDMLSLSLKLQEIKTASNQSIDLPKPKQHRAKDTVDFGMGEAVVASEKIEEKNRSILRSIVGADPSFRTVLSQ